MNCHFYPDMMVTAWEHMATWVTSFQNQSLYQNPPNHRRLFNSGIIATFKQWIKNEVIWEESWTNFINVLSILEIYWDCIILNFFGLNGRQPSFIFKWKNINHFYKINKNQYIFTNNGCGTNLFGYNSHVLGLILCDRFKWKGFEAFLNLKMLVLKI